MGRSVHNTRIERLWRDVYEGCLHLYYSIFSHLEFILHYVYHHESRKAWTVSGMHMQTTPCQPHSIATVRFWCNTSCTAESGEWIQCTATKCGYPRYVHMQGSMSISDGIDLSAPLPSSVSDDTVVVPSVSVPNPHLCLEQLRRYNVDPCSDDSNYGINLYRQALNILLWCTFSQHF